MTSHRIAGRNIRRLGCDEISRLRSEARRRSPKTGERLGQAFYNLLPPDIAEALAGTEADPFNDDARIGLAVAAISEGWVNL